MELPLAQVVEEYPALVTTLADDAAYASVEYYQNLAPQLDFSPQVQIDDTLGPRLKASARFALEEKATESFLEGTGVRAIRDTARNTLIENVKGEGGKWYRIPKEDACGFCRLLGTRGPVYRSEHAAAASHDKCKCEVAVQRPGMSHTRPAYMNAWDNDYRIARRETLDLGRSPSLDNIVNTWNRNIRAQNSSIDKGTRSVA